MLFTYQVINLSPSLQVLLLQIRNNFNQLVQSHLYVRDIAGDMELHDKNVIFKVDRVYPKVTTPNGKEMYLPREFSWCVEHEGQILFELHAQSRGISNLVWQQAMSEAFVIRLIGRAKAMKARAVILNILTADLCVGEKMNRIKYWIS